MPRPTMRCCRARPICRARSTRIGLPLMVKPASQGSSVGITKVKSAAESAARLRRGARRRPHRVRRGVHHRRRVHRGRAARSRPAVDPHPAGDRILRLPGEVLPQRYAISLPERPRRCGRGRTAGRGARRVSSDRLRRLGPRRFHARPRHRQILFHRDQHDAGHDRSQLGAHGGAPVPASTSRNWCGASSKPVSCESANELAIELAPQSVQEQAQGRKPPWQWPTFVLEWRTYARRARAAAAGRRRAWPRSPGRSIGRCA